MPPVKGKRMVPCRRSELTLGDTVIDLLRYCTMSSFLSIFDLGKAIPIHIL